MSKLQGEILTLPKTSGSVLTPKTLSGNIGVKGHDGATFIPFVSADGIISWTNDKNLPNPEPVNIKGANGKDGQNGYTPVRGVDYWTEADKAEIISSLCAVLYTEQELTEEQQAQARANIGASAVKVNLDNGVLSIE